jgi:hypothetical protein
VWRTTTARGSPSSGQVVLRWNDPTTADGAQGLFRDDADPSVKRGKLRLLVATDSAQDVTVRVVRRERSARRVR